MSLAREARLLEATRPEPFGGVPRRPHLDRMVELQMSAYPSGWSEADKRELAERYVFGEPSA